MKETETIFIANLRNGSMIHNMGRKKNPSSHAIGFQIKLIYPENNKIKMIFQNIEYIENRARAFNQTCINSHPFIENLINVIIFYLF